jgi:hypothetical protein
MHQFDELVDEAGGSGGIGHPLKIAKRMPPRCPAGGSP